MCSVRNVYSIKISRVFVFCVVNRTEAVTHHCRGPGQRSVIGNFFAVLQNLYRQLLKLQYTAITYQTYVQHSEFTSRVSHAVAFGVGCTFVSRVIDPLSSGIKSEFFFSFFDDCFFSSFFPKSFCTQNANTHYAHRRVYTTCKPFWFLVPNTIDGTIGRAK